jgi:hypothetical protein
MKKSDIDWYTGTTAAFLTGFVTQRDLREDIATTIYWIIGAVFLCFLVAGLRR